MINFMEAMPDWRFERLTLNHIPMIVGTSPEGTVRYWHAYDESELERHEYGDHVVFSRRLLPTSSPTRRGR
jgi:hypothetical protein